jgi:hypothetical protein
MTKKKADKETKDEPKQTAAPVAAEPAPAPAAPAPEPPPADVAPLTIEEPDDDDALEQGNGDVPPEDLVPEPDSVEAMSFAPPEPEPTRSDEEIVKDCEDAARELLEELLPDAASMVLPPEARGRIETLRLMHTEARQRIHEAAFGCRMSSPEQWNVGIDIDPELPPALEWLAHQARVHAKK